MSIKRTSLTRLLGSTMVSLSLCVSAAHAQVGELLWEDNFDQLSPEVWTVDMGDGCDQGICGWGNEELQWYASDNVSIQNIVGEGDNKALVIEARAENSHGKSFTSGKIISKNKIAVQYGLVETRVRVPNLATGLWPAVWMLGTGNDVWPSLGEIDIMEMGHRLQERTRQEHPNANINHYVGSNLIFYADAACVPGNPSCAASTAWEVDKNKPYVAQTSLSDRFVTYRLYWTPETIRFTVTDGGTEYDLYEQPFVISDESEEFRSPFYLLMNMAVGGNFTDSASAAEVTADLPAQMYIDYVRVYRYQGHGEVINGPISSAPSGILGVFTENPYISSDKLLGADGDFYKWDSNTSEGSATPSEGNNVISLQVDNDGTWFGGGFQTKNAFDMSSFARGYLEFDARVSADLGFKIGITDTYTNQHWINFPANEERYGLVRDGEWHKVRIPVSTLRGQLIAMQSLEYVFAYSSMETNLPKAGDYFAFDNIVWSDGESNCAAPPAATPTPTPAASPSPQPEPTSPPNQSMTFGVETLSTGSLQFFVRSQAWADVHYRLNSQVQQNVRMRRTDTKNIHDVAIAPGDQIEYRFTYWDAGCACAEETDWMIHSISN